MSLTDDLARQFRGDLLQLQRQVEGFPDDATLWRTLPGVTNSAGNLALHLEGNLREYIGRQLGQIPYVRNRALEFSASGISRSDLSARILHVAERIPPVIEGLTPEQLAEQYPEVVLASPLSTGEFLIHLYGHLSWHLGQIDYLRRIVTGTGTLSDIPR